MQMVILVKRKMWSFRRRYLFLVTGLAIVLATLYFFRDQQQVATTHHSIKGQHRVKGQQQPIKDMVLSLREDEYYRPIVDIKNIDNDINFQNRKDNVEVAKTVDLSLEVAEKQNVVSTSKTDKSILVKKDLAKTTNQSKVSASSAKTTGVKSIRYFPKSNHGNSSIELRESERKQNGWDTKEKSTLKSTRQKPPQTVDLWINKTKLGKLYIERGSGILDSGDSQRGLDRTQGSPAFWRRLDEYCNPPEIPVTGEEGRLLSGDYHLQSVHMILRHGDRTPMTNLRSVSTINWKPDWQCDLDGAGRKQSSQLTQLIESTKRSDSGETQGPKVATYLQRLPVGQHSRTCARAQMTPQGWLQQILLGQHMRTAYTGTLFTKKSSWRDPLLPVTIHSTGSARTQQSAFAFMFGLLPDLRYEDGARVVVNQHINFCRGISCSCPATSDLMAKKDTIFGKLQRENKNITALLQEMEGILLTPQIHKKRKKSYLPDIGVLLENFLAALCHNMSLPCGHTKCLTMDHVLRLVTFNDGIAEDVRGSEINPYVRHGRLYMHPLLNEIAVDMETMTNKTKKRPHFTLYSGHDITITPLIDALGFPDHRWPTFAAHIVFELWTDKFSQNYIRILYNGRDQTKYVRFCRSRINKDGLCPLLYFSSFIKHDNMQYFDTESYAEACQLNFKD